MFDFANSPTFGQTVTGTNGQTYTWDNVKWVASGSGTSYAPIASPTFTGDPKAPTPSPGDADTSIATTAFVSNALVAYAPIASPVFTGDARAVTPSPGDNDTSVATTAFITNALGGYATTAVAANNAGRNLIHNPLFNVAQRGAGPWTATGYTLDRWQAIVTLDTVSITQSFATDGNRASIGDETAYNVFLNNFTGNAGASAYNWIRQPIENIRRLAGKTVTVSLWAWTGSGTLKLGVGIDQYFGTGGSPSATISGIGATSFTLSTTPARFSASITIPSISGKTLGTNNDSCTYMDLWFSSGATNNAIAGGIGVQSGAIALWGVQLEVGAQATPLDYGGSPQQQLAQCQRFYIGSTTFNYLGYISAGSACHVPISLPVAMRATPTVTPSFSTAANITSPGMSADGPFLVRISGNGTAAGGFQYTGTFTASADL